MYYSLKSGSVKSDDAIYINKIANLMSTFNSNRLTAIVIETLKDVQESNDFSISHAPLVYIKENNIWEKIMQQQKQQRCSMCVCVLTLLVVKVIHIERPNGVEDRCCIESTTLFFSI